MGGITDKVKKKVTGVKDKVVGTADKATSSAKEKVSSSSTSSSSSSQSRKSEKGATGTRAERTKDSTKEYDEKEPMSPAKIKQHEPTAVRRDPNDQKIVERGQKSEASAEDAKEKARRSGMTKGTAGAAAAETGSEYEQGAAGSNK
jgi:hypothetical protein